MPYRYYSSTYYQTVVPVPTCRYTLTYTCTTYVCIYTVEEELVLYVDLVLSIDDSIMIHYYQHVNVDDSIDSILRFILDLMIHSMILDSFDFR